MNELAALIATARAWAPQKIAIATVVSTWGSAPRPRGSHMIVAADGRFEGSVSGGCVESDILATAAAVIAGAPATLRHYGVSNDDAWEVGLPCGGQIAVLVQPLSTAGFAPALFDHIEAAHRAGTRAVISTNLDTGVSTTGEGTDAFINIYRPPRRLLIVGAVQIAQSLAAYAKTLGIDVTVNDPRGRFLTPERFPAMTLSDAWPDEAVTAFAPGPDAAVVTLSHDIKIDDPALYAALAAPTGYVAALGSRKSHAARLERLSALGVAPEALTRIDGPAGIDIGSIGPSEIALSIAAAMVASLNRA